MIRRIRIEGYKSLASVELSRLGSLVLLFGPNASGKSNFLKALDLLSLLVSEDSLNDAFMKHIVARGRRTMPVRWLFYHPLGIDGPRQDEFKLVYDVDLELQPGIITGMNAELKRREEVSSLKGSYTRVAEPLLRYRLEIVYRSGTRSQEIVHESLIPLTSEGVPSERRQPFIQTDEEGQRLMIRIEKQSQLRYRSLPRRRTILSEVGDLASHPHIVATARELASIRVYGAQPVAVRSMLGDMVSHDPGSYGEKIIPYINWLEQEHPSVLGNLLRNLQDLVPGLTRIEVKETQEGFMNLWLTEGGGKCFPSELISDGTMRLLCLLGIAATPRPPAIWAYEEIEDGVHATRLQSICAIMERMADTPQGIQQFLTTYSTEVLDRFSEATLLECHQDADGTSISPPSSLPLLRRAEIRRALNRGGDSS